MSEAEWKDIASAPRDGTEFQAWGVVLHQSGPHAGTFVGYWEPRARFNAESEAFEIFGRVDYDEDGWDVYPHITPTHWQPQPSPPTPSCSPPAE